VRAGRRARSVCRRDRRPDSFGLSGPRCRHAAARPHCRHPRRQRQPGGCAGGQLPDRLSLQFRAGAVPGSCIRDHVPADAARPGVAAAGPVRERRRMTERRTTEPRTKRVVAARAALGVALVALVTVPLWVGNSYYVDVASQILLFAVFALALNVLVGYGGL